MSGKAPVRLVGPNPTIDSGGEFSKCIALRQRSVKRSERRPRCLGAWGSHQPLPQAHDVEPRIIEMQAREHYEALQAARKQQATEEFQQQYAARAGIESTHEQAVRRCGLRRARYIGLAKTHLQHLLTAVAINLVWLSDWWAGISPAKTRCSPFPALQWA